MEDIIRIHLAKTPYNIEKKVKAKLETYLQTLRNYIADPDIIQDIEQRITEVLADHHVVADGVIGQQELQAIIDQLGQPEDFIDQEDLAATTSIANTRQIHRYPAKGVLGGVASGLAVYFNIDVVWIRLAIILLTLTSFGTASLIYIVLWLIIPPVRSASDLLALQGKPITAQSIQQTIEVVGSLDRNNDQKALRVATFLLGLGLAVGVIATLALTAVGARLLTANDWVFSQVSLSNPFESQYWWIVAAAILSGLLLASLLAIWSYAAFAQKATKTILVASLAIMIAGVTAWTGVMIGIQHNQEQATEFIDQHTKQVTLTTPEGVAKISKLELRAKNIYPNRVVNYQASDGDFTANLSYFDHPNLKTKIQPTFHLDGQTLIVQLPDTSTSDYCGPYCPQTILSLTGPALTEIAVQNQSLDYTAQRQDQLIASVQGYNSSLTIDGGYIKHLAVNLSHGAQLQADQASINKVTLNSLTAGQVTLGNIAQLEINQPDPVCPSGNWPRVYVDSLIDSKYLLNGQETSYTQNPRPCLNLSINQLELQD